MLEQQEAYGLWPLGPAGHSHGHFLHSIGLLVTSHEAPSRQIVVIATSQSEQHLHVTDTIDVASVATGIAGKDVRAFL